MYMYIPGLAHTRPGAGGRSLCFGLGSVRLSFRLKLRLRLGLGLRLTGREAAPVPGPYEARGQRRRARQAARPRVRKNTYIPLSLSLSLSLSLYIYIYILCIYIYIYIYYARTYIHMLCPPQPGNPLRKNRPRRRDSAVARRPAPGTGNGPTVFMRRQARRGEAYESFIVWFQFSLLLLYVFFRCLLPIHLSVQNIWKSLANHGDSAQLGRCLRQPPGYQRRPLSRSEQGRRACGNHIMKHRLNKDTEIKQ